MLVQQDLMFSTAPRSISNISTEIQQLVEQSGITTGLCHVFCHHTSASLMLCENADPAVLKDLDTFMANLVPEGSAYLHDDEGPDDMPAHIRTILTHTDLTLPVSGGRYEVGIWQGIYLWEHRSQAHQRRLTVTITGE